jgi:hypothetical protein
LRAIFDWVGVAAAQSKWLAARLGRVELENVFKAIEDDKLPADSTLAAGFAPRISACPAGS